MENFEVASQIQEDLEIFGLAWRSSFAFDIKRAMLDQGLRNIDIAERLQVSEANISRMLRGDQNLKIETMYMLAAAVGEHLNIYIGDRFKDEGGFSSVFEDEEFSRSGEVLSFSGAWRSTTTSANDGFCFSEVANEVSVAFG